MTNKKLMKKIAPVVMSAAVAMTSMPYAVLASDFTDSEVLTDSTDFSVSEEFATEDAQEEFTTEDVQDAFAAEAQQGEAYVLMNIPYDDFYKAELKNNDVKVDAFTSATLNKSRTAGMMNGNSAYHVDPNGTDVTGVTFPVKVSDLSLLKDQKQVTDSDSVTITVTNRGQTSSNTYTGKDSLIENASYSYYILSETPSYYKELTVNADGSYSFSVAVDCLVWAISPDANPCITGSTWCGDCRRLAGCHVTFNGTGVSGINAGSGSGTRTTDRGAGRSGKRVSPLQQTLCRRCTKRNGGYFRSLLAPAFGHPAASRIVCRG